MKSKPVPLSQSGGWKPTVHCPGCGSACEEHQRQPKWTCSDPRCRFKFGFRLRPAGSKEASIIRAVPLDESGRENWSLSTAWPRDTEVPPTDEEREQT